MRRSKEKEGDGELSESRARELGLTDTEQKEVKR